MKAKTLTLLSPWKSIMGVSVYTIGTKDQYSYDGSPTRSLDHWRKRIIDLYGPDSVTEIFIDEDSVYYFDCKREVDLSVISKYIVIMDKAVARSRKRIRSSHPISSSSSSSQQSSSDSFALNQRIRRQY